LITSHLPTSRTWGSRLTKQGASFTGVYESIDSGERVVDQLDPVRFGHGLFLLVDAFPFQHPEAPQLSPIPLGSPSDATGAGRARLFGQGARGSIANFTKLELADATAPLTPSEIANALDRSWSERDEHQSKEAPG